MMEWFAEDAVTAADDAQVRELLRVCFPQTAEFKMHRYYLERPDFRWLVREEHRLIANAVMYEKVFLGGDQRFRIAGVGDVCVRPAYRGRGLVRQMLAAIHRQGRRRGCVFGFLFGDSAVYRSSGYRPCPNRLRYTPLDVGIEKIEVLPGALYVPLTEATWPSGVVDLQGPVF